MLAEAAAGTSQNHPLGQFCALATALVWAFALVLFKLSGERITPIALNLYKNAIGLALLLVTLAVLILLGQESLEPLRERTFWEIGILLLSGVLGIAVADSLFFHALNLIGLGLISIVDCCYAPIAILFSWLLLGEKLTAAHYVGAALIVAAVFTASQHARPFDRTRRQIIGGMLLAVLAIALMAFGIVMAKPVLERTPVVWSTTLRLAAGFAFLALFTFRRPDWRRHWTVFRPARSWRFALPGSILGTYVCLLLWVAGFKFTYASVAAVLNQTSVIFQSILAAFVLKEPYGRRQVTALLLGIAGIAVVRFGDQLAAALTAP